MKQKRRSPSVRSWSEKQPLPDSVIQRAAKHGKTASHLAESDDLPIEILEKEIPKTDLHDM